MNFVISVDRPSYSPMNRSKEHGLGGRIRPIYGASFVIDLLLMFVAFGFAIFNPPSNGMHC